MNKEQKDMKRYFISEEHMIIFALLYTDMSTREKILGISPVLYSDGKKAKKWRNSLEKKIHPDTCKIEGANEAVKKINELYDRMTKYTKEEKE